MSDPRTPKAAGIALRDPGPPARTKPSWYGARAIAVMSALYAAFLLPGAIVLGATLRLTDSRGCAASGSKVDGVLVGETEQRIYVGERRRGGREDRHIVAIPSDHGAEVVGDDAHRLFATNECRRLADRSLCSVGRPSAATWTS